MWCLLKRRKIKEQGAGSRGAGSRGAEAGAGAGESFNSKLKTFFPHSPLPTPYSLLPTPHSPLPTPHSPLPTPRNTENVKKCKRGDASSENKRYITCMTHL